MIENKELLTLPQAIKAVKDNAKAAFDETVELHINLNIDVKQSDQIIRVPVNLPNGTGKEVKVATFASKKISNADLELTESDIEKIEKNKIRPKMDFDVLIVEPQYMAKLGKLGPILGPAGVMPNPKTGTVTDNVQKAVEEFKKGKVELRNEPSAPIIHVSIGKTSFTEEKLVENFRAIWNILKSNKPQKAKPDWIVSIFLSSSMGKSVKVDLTSL